MRLRRKARASPAAAAVAAAAVAAAHPRRGTVALLVLPRARLAIRSAPRASLAPLGSLRVARVPRSLPRGVALLLCVHRCGVGRFASAIAAVGRGRVGRLARQRSRRRIVPAAALFARAVPTQFEVAQLERDMPMLLREVAKPLAGDELGSRRLLRQSADPLLRLLAGGGVGGLKHCTFFTLWAAGLGGGESEGTPWRKKQNSPMRGAAALLPWVVRFLSFSRGGYPLEDFGSSGGKRTPSCRRSQSRYAGTRRFCVYVRSGIWPVHRN